MMLDRTPYLLSLGHKSPWSKNCVPKGGGSSIILDSIMPIIVSFLPNPTNSEIRAYRTAMVEIAVEHEKTSAILLFRIKPRIGKPLFVETPFHIGNELVSDHKYFLPLEDSEDGSLKSCMVLQDQNDIIICNRLINIPFNICKSLVAIIDAQKVDSEFNDFEVRHANQLERYYARTKTPEIGFLGASVKGLASPAVE